MEEAEMRRRKRSLKRKEAKKKISTSKEEKEYREDFFELLDEVRC
jgi:hypothetical protein